MSQNDFTLANDTGANFRTDANSALQALASQSSGGSAPSTTFSYQRWADTSNGVVKRRNAANGAWVLDASLAETFVVGKSSGYTVAITDFQTLLDCTGSFTLALTAAATLGDGFWCAVRNAGSSTITIDPASTEQIDGATTLKLYPGDACHLWCSGSSWRTVGLTDGPRTIGSASPSSAATVDFTSGLDGPYDIFECEYDLVPATDDVYLHLVMGTGGGPTWQTGAGAYSWSGRFSGVSAGADSGSGADVIDTRICLSRPGSGQGVGNGSGEHIAGSFRVFSPASSTNRIQMEGASSYHRADGTCPHFTGGGAYLGVSVTGLRLAFSSGDIASGWAVLRARRRPR